MVRSHPIAPEYEDRSPIREQQDWSSYHNEPVALANRRMHLKKLLIAVIAALAITTPAVAQAADFTGPRIEATASVVDVTKARDTTDISYGAVVGVDVAVADKVTLGVEASSDNPFDKNRTVGAAARLGYIVADNVLLFGKVGYDNYRNVGRNLDGLRLGGGVEVNVSDNAFVKVEGRYADFEKGVGTAGALVGVGLRF